MGQLAGYSLKHSIYLYSGITGEGITVFKPEELNHDNHSEQDFSHAIWLWMECLIMLKARLVLLLASLATNISMSGELSDYAIAKMAIATGNSHLAHIASLTSPSLDILIF